MYEVWTINDMTMAQVERGHYADELEAKDRADYETDGKRSFLRAVVLNGRGVKVYTSRQGSEAK